MLAGYSSSTLLSPRHRLRSEAPSAVQFQACHFPMNTQRLDLPCSFSRKETTPRSSQQIRPVGRSISLEKPIEPKTSSCSLKQNIRLPPLATTTTRSEARREFEDRFSCDKGKKKSLKRFADQGFVDEDESCVNRAKRKRGESDENLSFAQLGCGNFWFEHLTGQNSPQVPFALTCSGDEAGVCFVPGGAVSQPLPNHPHWFDSVINELTGIGDKDGETSRPPVKEASGSSASSEGHSLGFKFPETATTTTTTIGHEVGNGSRNPNVPEGTSVVGTSEEVNNGNHGETQKDFELLSLLTGCVEAIGSKNISAVNQFIARLGDLASPRGKTPITRLTAYYTEALALRVTRLWPHIFHIIPPREFVRMDEDESGTALRLLNQISPIPKFIQFTMNEMLLRAFEGKERVHIIDFDIKQGLQWPSFFQSLASRPNPPVHVRITGIGESKQELNETGDRLHGFAEAWNLPFEFHPVVDRLEDVRLWMLHVKEGESVAVNCVLQLHKTLYDTSGSALRDFLGLVRSTNPIAVVIAEQEAEHNGIHLETRVCNSLKYYSAIFDSIHSSLPSESLVRLKIEETFAREIRSIVACEGSHRLERHEGFEKWRRRLEQLGFRCLGTSERETLQSQMLLKMYSSKNYGVKKQEEDDGITLSWLDQPLYTVSAWTPPGDMAGSSSSFSQPS